MRASTRIRDEQWARAWTDETLLGLILDALDASPGAAESILLYLSDVARLEGED